MEVEGLLDFTGQDSGAQEVGRNTVSNCPGICLALFFILIMSGVSSGLPCNIFFLSMHLLTYVLCKFYTEDFKMQYDLKMNED